MGQAAARGFKKHQSAMTNPLPISATTRALHLVYIVLAVISFGSGYIAFDTAWSGIGVLNRSTYFMAHQTSGAALLVLTVIGLARMIGRKGSRRVRPSVLDHLASFYHVGLLGSFFAVSAVALWGTACGEYPFHLAHIIRMSLSLPQAVCFTPFELFDWHKLASNALLYAVGLHTAAAVLHLVFGRDRRFQEMFKVVSNQRNAIAE